MIHLSMDDPYVDWSVLDTVREHMTIKYNALRLNIRLCDLNTLHK